MSAKTTRQIAEGLNQNNYENMFIIFNNEIEEAVIDGRFI